MKLTSVVSNFAVALAIVDGSFAAPQSKRQAVQFNSQKFTMSQLRSRKEITRQRSRDAGAFDLDKYPSVSSVNACTNGKVADTYTCKNVDMYGFLSHQVMGSTTREGNDVWGWTSPDGRDIAAVGQTDGTAFVELMKNGTLKYLGRLPTQTESSIWRDMKIIDGYVYIGSEAQDHGLQVFDLRKVLTLTSPKEFSIKTDMTAHFDKFGSSHNIVANEDTKTIYAVGSKFCNKGGLFMVDVSNPESPKDLGCASEDGYVHDAQCLLYNGPDTQFKGKEICFGYNEDTLTIYDVTTKSSPKILSRTAYNGAAYTHQGWIANDAQTHLLLDDELDEQSGTAPRGNNGTTTYIWDITKLTAPKNTGVYQSSAKSIDHNQYVLKGKSYMANYSSGLRIVDVSTIASDPTGSSFKELGYFDVYPEDDSKQENEFHGAWSVYPFTKSGFILVNTIERGLFSLKYTGA